LYKIDKGTGTEVQMRKNVFGLLPAAVLIGLAAVLAISGCGRNESNVPSVAVPHEDIMQTQHAGVPQEADASQDTNASEVATEPGAGETAAAETNATSDKGASAASVMPDIEASAAADTVVSTSAAIQDIIARVMAIPDPGSQKVAGRWEELEAADIPLLAAIPEKDTYLYAAKTIDGVILRVKDTACYYNWLYMTPRGIFPRMEMRDYDGDGAEELSIILYIGSGTGVSVEELHMIELTDGPAAAGGQEDHCFDTEDFVQKIRDEVQFKTFLKAGELMGAATIGKKTHTVSLKEYQTEDFGKVNDALALGDIVGFPSDNGQLKIELGAGITGQYAFSPSYIGMIFADVHYNSGVFSLKNLRFGEYPY
jgi:hypothetical protein